MRLVRLLLAAATVASMSVAALPAHAAGGLTKGCELTGTTATGSTRTGTLSSGVAYANDGTSPEIVCAVQTTPQPGQGAVFVQSARGLACLQSECKGDYYVCYYAQCDGDGWICLYSHCDSGSLCYQSTCTPDVASSSLRASWLSPRSVSFTAPQGAQLFACTTVRWHRGDVVQDQFFGCAQATG